MFLGENTQDNALAEKVKPFLPATQYILDNEAPILKKECLRISNLKTLQSKLCPELLQEIISSKDPSDLPQHGASFIDHEGFYKKAIVENFGMEPGLSYKKLYLERIVADTITTVSSPSSNDKCDVNSMVRMVYKDFIPIF